MRITTILLVQVMIWSHTQLLAQTNVKLNQDQGTAAQNEVSIAVNPTNENNIVVVAHDWRTGVNLPGFYYTTNGGSNWLDGVISQVGGNYLHRATDPSIVFDNNGYAYYSFIGIDHTNFFSDNGLFVQKSADGGANWGTLYTVAQHGTGGHGIGTQTILEDKPYLSADISNSSPHAGNVYLTWRREVEEVSADIYFSRLVTGSGGFTTPMRISDAGEGRGPMPAVGPSGVVYVAWYDDTNDRILLDRSFDGGQTFGSDIIVNGVSSYADPVCVDKTGNSFPSIAVDTSHGPYRGNIYLVWCDKELGFSDIYFKRGVVQPDQSIEWGPRTVISVQEPQGIEVDQYFPWITVSRNGVIAIVFYDNYTEPYNNLYAEVRVLMSVDAGQSFTSDVATEQTIDFQY